MTQLCNMPLVVESYGGGVRWHCPSCDTRHVSGIHLTTWTNGMLPTNRMCGIHDDRPRPYFEYDINCGQCEEWAEKVHKLLDGLKIKSEVLGNDQMPKYEHLSWHVFIRIGRKYYDCECLEGTTRVRNLPIFGRNDGLSRGEVRKIQATINRTLSPRYKVAEGTGR